MARPRPLAGLKAWLITDDKAGMKVQAEGVATALGLDWESKQVAPRGIWRFTAPYGPPDPRDGKQLARAPNSIGAKEEHAVGREHRGDEPKAQCHCSDDRQGRKRCAAERPERVEDVACQVIDETGATSVATLIGGQRHRAEARDRLGASVDGAQTGGDVLLRLALDVERELLVELAFDALGSHQRANPQEQVAEVHAFTPVS